MTNKYLILTLVLGLAGCGEAFESTYTGRATVSQNSCPSGNEGEYNVRVRAKISGGSVELTVLEMINASTNRVDRTADYIANVRLDASFANGGTDFYVDNAGFVDSDIDRVSANGIINTDRTEITGFRMVRLASDSTGATCVVQMNSSKLTRE